MLEFKETFNKGQQVTLRDIPTIMQCKNIDFGHVDWIIPRLYDCVLNDNIDFMKHLVNHIIDITARDNNNEHYHSFISGISLLNKSVFEYIMNNRCIYSELSVTQNCNRMLQF